MVRPGGLISTLSKEPPSLKSKFRLVIPNKALTLKQLRVSNILQFDRQVLNRISFLMFGLLIFCSQIGEINSLIKIKRNITRYRPDNIDYVIGGFFDPQTISINSLSLAQVAYKGQNIGGTEALLASSKKLANTTGQVTQYVVAPGDTLSGIAQKYDLHSGSIVLENKDVDDPEVLKVGQILNIPPVDRSSEELEKEFSDRQKKIAVAKSKAQPTKSKTTTKKSASFIIPVKYSYISQYFGGSHTGVDYVAPVGTPIKAAQAGCVISMAKGWNGGYGTMVHLSHGSGISTLYAHLSSFSSSISSGGCVDSGEVIGYVGLTGRTTGAHLHFEYRVSGVPTNPGR